MLPPPSLFFNYALLERIRIWKAFIIFWGHFYTISCMRMCLPSLATPSHAREGLEYVPAIHTPYTICILYMWHVSFGHQNSSHMTVLTNQIQNTAVLLFCYSGLLQGASLLGGKWELCSYCSVRRSYAARVDNEITVDFNCVWTLRIALREP